jgi:hypothetical protein
MSSAREQRRIRLKNDFQSMQNITRSWLTWKAVSGPEPYVESYELSIDLRTIVGSGPNYSNKHKIVVNLPGTYPHKSAPQVVYRGSPKPFHPNWFVDGRWCSGVWLIHEGLGEFVVRMIQTLQYHVLITNERSAANSEANSWYMREKESGKFPCDKTELPDPTSSRIKISGSKQNKKFLIK